MMYVTKLYFECTNAMHSDSMSSVFKLFLQVDNENWNNSSHGSEVGRESRGPALNASDRLWNVDAISLLLLFWIDSSAVNKSGPELSPGVAVGVSCSSVTFSSSTSWAVSYCIIIASTFNACFSTLEHSPHCLASSSPLIALLNPP